MQDEQEEISKRGFKVEDRRNGSFFFIDEEYFRTIAKCLDPIATAVYASLCRRAGRNGSPASACTQIAREHRISHWTVMRKIKLLQDWNIIKAKKIRNEQGNWVDNSYLLLDKSEWHYPDSEES